MKTYIKKLLVVLALFAGVHQLAAQGTAFTYQGHLNDGTNSATGIYDFQFQVFDAATAGTSYGNPNPNTITGLGVTNGMFTVTLDFGTGVFTGPARWLQTMVRTNGNPTYTTLSTRQELTPTPYAIYSGNAATLGGQASTAYVAKAGDTMTGTLNLPADGLTVGGSQLITSGGDIGIGTTSPGGLLDVEGSSAGSFGSAMALFQNNNASGFAAPALRVVGWGNTSQGALSVSANGSGLIARFGNDNNFVADIQTNGTFDAVNGNFSGNVGIGTTSPSVPLQVETIGTTNGILSELSADGTGTAGAAAIEGIYTQNGTYGELGVAYYPNGEFPLYYGVYGHSTSSGYAGYFDGQVLVGGELIGHNANFGGNVSIAGGVSIEQSQASVTLTTDSSDNGSVLTLLNDSSSPTYVGAINFATASATPGQIGYFASDDSIRFRRANVPNAMVLDSSGLSVNGTFVSSSDRNAKENFRPISAQEILQKVAALPVTRWNYKQDTTSEHIGPMAQDFYAAFNVGPDDKHITTIDESGIAFAAIQGLNQKVDAKDTEIQTLKQQNNSVQERLEALEQAVQSLAEKK